MTVELSDDELLRLAYLERHEDAIAMALAQRLEMLLEGIAKLINQPTE